MNNMDGNQILSYCRSRNKIYTNYILELEEVLSVDNKQELFNQKIENLMKDIFDDERFIFELESSDNKLSKPVMDIIYGIRKSYANTMKFYESFKILHKPLDNVL